VPPPETPSPADAVLMFVESVGRRSEAELYLKLFRQLPKESFAVIAPGTQVLLRALGSLVEQLRFLHDLGLAAPVVLGLFDPATPLGGAERLAKRLPSVGLEPSLHDAGEVDLAERLREELRSEKVPVVQFPAEESVSIDERFSRVGEITRALGTRKLVLVRRQGGLGPKGERSIDLGSGHILAAHAGGISVVNLRNDRDALVQSRRLRKDDAELFEQISRLLSSPDASGLVVSVASPLNLLKELFTVKGAGTLLKAGTAIDRHSSYATVDVGRLRDLLESSFSRRLEPTFFECTPLAVYVDAGYRGVAILHASSVAPFLTKFAVEPVAQGEGIGQDLWQALLRDHPAVFWRARSDNPITGWYMSLCDGMQRTAHWHVFWRGVDAARVPDLVAEALARPADFGTEPG
jgi:hypothetical protein